MKYLSILIATILLISCDNTTKQDKSLLSKSVGNINVLQVVMENDLWNGDVGEEVRTHFAAPTDGLPQDEPLFSMNQMPQAAFSGFARKSRLILFVSLADENRVSIAKDSYAKPQTVAYVKGKTKEDLVALIKSKQAQIINEFHEAEIEERQRRTNVSLMDTDSLQSDFGVSMRIPSAYRIAKKGEDFYWIRKDLKDGSTNIIVYEVPLSMITSDSTAVADIIKIRDSIGGALLPVEDGGQFQTEKAYAPYIFTSEIDGKFAYETKGTWDVKDQFMAGPFLNYAIRDEENNRYLIIEGFSYAPRVRKRDLQFELESILKSARLD
ncbi:DUF4837 family protein [Jejudonia soesokkakensis]|uniref:DUF4837 family protein n=1 Tax=Jejudonia soesokkakensis TaxID=1323432 RepID=A0ABW2MR30_9FLAO